MIIEVVIIMALTLRIKRLNIPMCRAASSMISAQEIETKSPYQELRVNMNFKTTKNNPIKVNAYGEERTIACVCDDLHFLTLKKGPPIHCKCNQWFQLVDAKKFWKGQPPQVSSHD